MYPARLWPVPRFVLITAVTVLAAGLYGIPTAHATTSYRALAVDSVDAHDPDLELTAGATLAPPKVLSLAAPKALDIKVITEDQSGDERREDTNADVTFALQAEVLFGKDSATLNDEAKTRIGAIAEEIRKQQHATSVRVFGFTDSLGSSDHGDVLSKQRANAVQGVLEEDLNDPAVTFEVRGYGEQYPIADNATEAGRKKNRRVEVTFPHTGS